ncbi:MAG TPA: hypothetical protein VIA81_00175 [Acidimicrobiia bacterium]|jgi:hypothetical protein
MGQQPRIEITQADLPRRTAEPDPPRRWRPGMRPGMITDPVEMKWGGAFGTPGPDTGFALKIIRTVDLDERSPALEQVLAALMAARASLLGRAPTIEDLEVAKIVAGIGYNLPAHLGERRERWLRATAHEASPGKTAVADVDADLLRHKPEAVAKRLRLLGE